MKNKVISIKKGEIFFQSNLEYLLRTKKIKIYQFAKEIGVSRQTVFCWLKTGSIENVQQSLKVAKFFKISIEELFLRNLTIVQEFDRAA